MEKTDSQVKRVVTINISTLGRLQGLAMKRWLDGPISNKLNKNNVLNVALLLIALEEHLNSQHIDVPFVLDLENE